MSRSYGWSMCRISTQLAPSCCPAQTSRIDQGSAPSVENTMNWPIGMRATPAGNEMNVRTIGMSRLKNAVAGPYFWKNRSASSSSCGRMSRYLP